MFGALGGFGQQQQKPAGQQQPQGNSSTIINLIDFIDLPQTEFKNIDEKYSVQNVLFDESDQTFIKSDADEQMILNFKFKEKVRLNFISFKSIYNEEAPKVLKVFINKGNMDFDQCQSTQATQEFVLNKDSFQKLLELKTVNFMYVQNVTLFVESNNGGDVSTITSVKLYGAPNSNTDLSKYEKCKT